TALFALVAFSTDLGSASTWAYKQDVGGRHIGSIHGWANMWGNLGATLSPLSLNALVNQAGWDAAFLACAGSFFIAGLATLGVDATIPIADQN
ncbi:MAG: MFS transporter, partial [Planctomycetaceae bacterium]|nr:MFS transporter [Planctomycetaceae bacterium]